METTLTTFRLLPNFLVIRTAFEHCDLEREFGTTTAIHMNWNRCDSDLRVHDQFSGQARIATLG